MKFLSFAFFFATSGYPVQYSVKQLKLIFFVPKPSNNPLLESCCAIRGMNLMHISFFTTFIPSGIHHTYA